MDHQSLRCELIQFEGTYSQVVVTCRCRQVVEIEPIQLTIEQQLSQHALKLIEINKDDFSDMNESVSDKNFNIININS